MLTAEILKPHHRANSVNDFKYQPSLPLTFQGMSNQIIVDVDPWTQSVRVA